MQVTELLLVIWAHFSLVYQTAVACWDLPQEAGTSTCPARPSWGGPASTFQWPPTVPTANLSALSTQGRAALGPTSPWREASEGLPESGITARGQLALTLCLKLKLMPPLPANEEGEGILSVPTEEPECASGTGCGGGASGLGCSHTERTVVKGMRSGCWRDLG